MNYSKHKFPFWHYFLKDRMQSPKYWVLMKKFLRIRNSMSFILIRRRDKIKIILLLLLGFIFRKDKSYQMINLECSKIRKMIWWLYLIDNYKIKINLLILKLKSHWVKTQMKILIHLNSDWGIILKWINLNWILKRNGICYILMRFFEIFGKFLFLLFYFFLSF